MSYKKGDVVELNKPKEYYKIVKKQPYGYDVRELYSGHFECISEDDIKSGTIDEQTIHFWHLQLQFMELGRSDYMELFKMARAFGVKYDYNAASLDDAINFHATELALHLSGLA